MRPRHQTRRIKLRRATTQKRSWGYHLIVNAGSCQAAAIRSKPTIAAFVKELVSSIDMVAYGAPRIVRFGTGNKAGYTLVQLIETSDITAHFCEETNDVYIDIFSCKPFSPKDALRVIDHYFHPQRKNTTFLKRQA